MTKRQKKRLFTILISLALLLVARFGVELEQVKQVASNIQPGYYAVKAVSDGDTFVVDMDGTEERVRLIGVDTPETQRPNSSVQCFGKAASDYTTNLLSGKSVRLEADSTNSNRDRYQRLLRYAYLDDGRLVNAELIKEGYGFAYVQFPFLKMEEFKSYQQVARENNKGLWGGCEISDPDGRGQTNDVE